MDRWTFPIGTKLWKLFSHGANKLETRLIERYGPGPDDYWMGSFVWNAEGTDAVFAVDGAQNINRTDHDAPAQKLCPACHNGDDGRVLGFSAMQLSRTPEGPTLSDVAARGWLTDPPPAGADYTPPGDDVVSSALGYLHANCGHCHNPHGTSWPDTQMNLRLRVADKKPEDTPAYQSAVGQKLNYYVRHPGVTLRIAPGDPASSAVIVRMSTRAPREAMPPLATEFTDMTGIATVTRWIASLPH
jgi:cytochrome c553